MEVALSINKVPIRLTNERWLHITTGHPEMADYYYDLLEAIEEPDVVYEGNNEAQIAVKMLDEKREKHIVCIFKEISREDGFVITSYLTKNLQQFERRKTIWKNQK